MRLFSRLVFVPNHPRARIDFSSSAYRYALLSAASLTVSGPVDHIEFAEPWRVTHETHRRRSTHRACPVSHRLTGLGPRSGRMGSRAQAESLPERAGGIRDQRIPGAQPCAG